MVRVDGVRNKQRPQTQPSAASAWAQPEVFGSFFTLPYSWILYRNRVDIVEEQMKDTDQLYQYINN